MVGIVLGAGASRRLGRPKQTLPFGDTTLLGYALGQAEASALERVVLVVGGAADEALAGVELTRASVARNDSYGTGCASSLLAGLDAAGEAEAIMLLLGDMPGVGAAAIDEVMSEGQPGQAPGAITINVADPQVIDLTGAGVPPGMEDQVRQAMEMAQQHMGQMPGAASAGGDDRVSQLERLAKLRDSGALTDAEFEAEKAKLLGG